MRRLWGFIRLVLVLVALMYGAWLLSAALLPQGVLRAYFTHLFSARVGEFSAGRVFAANLAPFLGIQFMNLFRMRKRPGGLYILPLFWILYGVLLGTNSFVFAGPAVRLSLAVLWEARTASRRVDAWYTGVWYRLATKPPTAPSTSPRASSHAQRLNISMYCLSSMIQSPLQSR